MSITVDGWTILFGGPNNTFLRVGEYDNAKRFPFSNESPGLEFYGNGRGASTLDGKFRVWELEIRGNQVMRFAVDFIQKCEGKQPPLYGTIRINSSLL